MAGKKRKTHPRIGVLHPLRVLVVHSPRRDVTLRGIVVAVRAHSKLALVQEVLLRRHTSSTPKPLSAKSQLVVTEREPVGANKHLLWTPPYSNCRPDDALALCFFNSAGCFT